MSNCPVNSGSFQPLEGIRGSQTSRTQGSSPKCPFLFLSDML
jgi:hypothetical protein